VIWWGGVGYQMSERDWAPCAKSNCYPKQGFVVPKGVLPMAVLFLGFSVLCLK
jgi:hypothetical protein